MSVKTKDEIFEQTIKSNIERKSVFVDNPQMISDMPLFSWIDINPTELCNRKCSFCPRVDDAIYPNQNLHMSSTLTDKMAKELRKYNYKGAVIFSGYGEPLLHPKFVDLVSSFGHDIHTELVTNGDKLNEQYIKDLFDAGLDVLLISMYDGPHQIDYFKNMLESAGIAEEHYVLRDRWYSIDEDYGLKLTNRAGLASEGNQTTVDTKKPCFYTHYSMMIDWNGDVMLCVQDWHKKVKFGNITEQSLLDVWSSVNFKKYRKMLGNGSRNLFPCNQCNVDGTLHGFNHADIWKNIYN